MKPLRFVTGAGMARTCGALGLIVGLLPALATGAAPPKPQAMTVVTVQNLFPESLSWSAKRQRFLVGSVLQGTVGTVDLRGRYAPFIAGTPSVSTLGIRVDDRHDRVWVVSHQRAPAAPADGRCLRAVPPWRCMTCTRAHAWASMH